MSDAATLWQQALPTIQNAISGRGVWAALNAARPVTVDEGVLIIGFLHEDSQLAAHLRLAQNHRVVEHFVSKQAQKTTKVRIIDGITEQDYEIVKRRDAERRRLQEQEMAKMRAEMQARTSWESVYEQLSRRWSAVSNKSLPQNRARFFEEAIEIVAAARKDMEATDDMSERNFARCLERVAQYVEMPSTFVATQVLQRTGEI
jgi:altronate dehydratase